MAQNVTIAGASYTGVPAIEVPKTGGGTATFADPSGVTAGDADVVSGKKYLNSSGVLRTGTLASTDAITVNIASFNSLPQTVSDASITADHVAVHCELGTPTAMTGDWTITTSAGSLTVSGTMTGSTTLQLVLVKSGTSI